MPTWRPLLAATASLPAALQGGEQRETKQSAAVVLSMLTQASRSVRSCAVMLLHGTNEQASHGRHSSVHAALACNALPQRHASVQKIHTACKAALSGNRVQVFRTFAEALLAEQLHEEDEIEGICYEHLFRLCRERFLVNSDATMRPHLTEFRDHDLTKTRKGPDGVDLLYIPLPPVQLRALVADLSESATRE